MQIASRAVQTARLFISAASAPAPALLPAGAAPVPRRAAHLYAVAAHHRAASSAARHPHAAHRNGCARIVFFYDGGTAQAKRYKHNGGPPACR